MFSRKLQVCCWLIFIRIDVTLHQCPRTILQVPNSSSNATGSVVNNGAVVRITCNSGYGGFGDNEFYRCDNDTWVGDYKCLRFCEVIDSLENGEIANKPSYFVGSWIVFACNDGYTMNGKDSLLCRADGKWRPPDPPTCEIVSCGEFGNVQNGRTSQETVDGTRNLYGNKITVTCDLGFVRSGRSEVYCKADGTWGSKPVCQPSSCGSHPGSNSSCIEDTDLTPDGSIITHLCLSQSSDTSVTKIGSGTAICSDNQWDEPNTGCYCDCKIEANFTEVKVMNLVNGKFLKHGTKLNWACKAGYRKESIAEISCDDGRYNWINPPKCVQVPTSTVTEIIASTASPTQKLLTESANTDTSTLKVENREDSDMVYWLIPVVVIAILGIAVAVVVVVLKKVIRKSENPISIDNEVGYPEKNEMLPRPDENTMREM